MVGGVITLAGFFAMPWINALFFQMSAFDVAQQLSRSSSFSRSTAAQLDVLLLYATPVIGLLLLVTAFGKSERWIVVVGAVGALTALLLIVQANQPSTFRLAQPGSGYGAATLGLALGGIAGLAIAAASVRDGSSVR